MKNEERPVPQKYQGIEQFYDTQSVQSSTEMTGLTPTPPVTEDEAESYSEIHGMPVPEGVPNATKKRNK